MRAARSPRGARAGEGANDLRTGLVAVRENGDVLAAVEGDQLRPGDAFPENLPVKRERDCGVPRGVDHEDGDRDALERRRPGLRRRDVIERPRHRIRHPAFEVHARSSRKSGAAPGSRSVRSRRSGRRWSGEREGASPYCQEGRNRDAARGRHPGPVITNSGLGVACALETLPHPEYNSRRWCSRSPPSTDGYHENQRVPGRQVLSRSRLDARASLLHSRRFSTLPLVRSRTPPERAVPLPGPPSCTSSHVRSAHRARGRRGRTHRCTALRDVPPVCQ